MKSLVFIAFFAAFASEIKENIGEFQSNNDVTQETCHKPFSKPSRLEKLEAIVPKNELNEPHKKSTEVEEIVKQKTEDKMIPKNESNLSDQSPLCVSKIYEFLGADEVSNMSFTCVRFKKVSLILYNSLEPIPLTTKYLKPLPLCENFNMRENSKKFLAPARLLNGEFLVSPLFDPHKVCKVEHKGTASLFTYYVASPYDFELKNEGTLASWYCYPHLNSKVSNPRLTHCLVAAKSSPVEQFTVTGRLNVKDHLKLIGAVGNLPIVRHEDPNTEYFKYRKYNFLLRGKENGLFQYAEDGNAYVIRKDVILFFTRPEAYKVIIHAYRVVNGQLMHSMSLPNFINFERLNMPDLKIPPMPSVMVDEHNIILSWKQGPNKFQIDHPLVHLISKDPTVWEPTYFIGPFDAYEF